MEEPGRLVRWPRPGSEGGSRGLTFVEEPDLVVLEVSVEGRAGDGAPATNHRIAERIERIGASLAFRRDGEEVMTIRVVVPSRRAGVGV